MFYFPGRSASHSVGQFIAIMTPMRNRGEIIESRDYQDDNMSWIRDYPVVESSFSFTSKLVDDRGTADTDRIIDCHMMMINTVWTHHLWTSSPAAGLLWRIHSSLCWSFRCVNSRRLLLRPSRGSSSSSNRPRNAAQWLSDWSRIKTGDGGDGQ